VAKRRAAGEGGLFQRKSDDMWVGSYEVRTYDGKRRQKRVYAKTYKKCRAKLKELRDAIDDGYVPSESTTTADWLTHWIENVKGPHVRPKTKEFYEESIRLHIIPSIGKKRLGHLTPEDVRQMLITVKTSSNRKRAHSVLNLALKSAVKNGVLRRNICEAVEIPGHLPVRRSAFTVKQAQTIIRAGIKAEASRDATAGEAAVATLWAAAFLSGARPAELLGLEWSRVDLDNAVADFSWQLQQLTKVHGCGEPSTEPPAHPRRPDRPPKGPLFYPCQRAAGAYCPEGRWDFPDGYEYRECYKSLVWTRPKTQTGVRIVPLIPGLVEMLRQHAKVVEPNPYALVWHNVDGRPLSPTDAHALWKALLSDAKIETKPWYSARHSTATMLQAYGVPQEVRMRLMGQSSVAAHQGYVHVDQTQTRAALANLDALLS
jgi:integrase